MIPRRSMVSFERPDGDAIDGYLAEPDGAAADVPAVIVFQEWWGLNDQIRGVADRLAWAGYRALVPDLYRGRCTFEEEEAHHLMDGLDFSDVVSQDVAGTLRFLRTQSRHVAAMGYCMGGALTLLALSRHAEFSAGVVWYGYPPLDQLDVARIHVPLIGHWGLQDAFFDTGTVNEIESRLRTAHVDAQFHRYLAHHAFANETAVGPGRISRTQFDPVWAQQAWDRTLTFLGRTMWPDTPLPVRSTPDTPSQ
jgi:carboxymethylenebutenolidase